MYVHVRVRVCVHVHVRFVCVCGVRLSVGQYGATLDHFLLPPCWVRYVL